MDKQNVIVSVIIIYYKTKKEIFDCLESIRNADLKVSYEVIVVDNDERKTIETALKKKFPSVKYIKSRGNIGFGAGNNLGAKYAKGEFLFFLNPDTQICARAIDILVNFLKNNKEAAIVAPLLLNPKGIPYPLQGTGPLTPLSGIVALSFLNKLCPENPVSRKYWLLGWDKRGKREVGVAPGTAFMMPRSIFQKVGGFDPKFFLYFEESDLCRRIKKAGWKIFILPEAKVIHFWGRSTTQSPKIKKIFSQSRFYYFQKHYGLLWAMLVQFFTEIRKGTAILSLTLALAAFLRFYRLSELATFIGDQGWFYLSARDLILYHKIPLVGITASITWLHQGALWTYLLAPALWLSNFHPVSGACLTALFGVASVFLVYQVGKDFFSERVGLMAAAFYATSPWIVFQDRMAYHTSIIPFFTLLFFWALFKLCQGEGKYLSWVALLLALLYQLELATVVLVGIFLMAFWHFQPKIKKRELISALIFFLLALAPILIYDLTSGFKQTVGFLAWIFYRLTSFFGFFGGEHLVSGEKFLRNLAFFAEYGKRILAWGNPWVAQVLTGGILATLVYYLLRKNPGLVLVILWLLISILGFFLQQAPSEAYIPPLFPVITLWVGLMFDRLMSRRILFYPAFCLFLIIVGYNAFSFTSSGFLKKIYKPTFLERVEVAKFIITKTQGEPYNLLGKGPGSEFENFTKNWQYLTWWLGKPPSKSPESLRFIISENQDKINLTIKKDESKN